MITTGPRHRTHLERIIGRENDAQKENSIRIRTIALLNFYIVATRENAKIIIIRQLPLRLSCGGLDEVLRGTTCRTHDCRLPLQIRKKVVDESGGYTTGEDHEMAEDAG